MFKCVSHMFEVTCLTGVYSHIHFFPPSLPSPSPTFFKNYNHYIQTQMAKNCGTNCLNMGKFLS